MSLFSLKCMKEAAVDSFALFYRGEECLHE